MCLHLLWHGFKASIRRPRGPGFRGAIGCSCRSQCRCAGRSPSTSPPFTSQGSQASPKPESLGRWLMNIVQRRHLAVYCGVCGGPGYFHMVLEGECFVSFLLPQPGDALFVVVVRCKKGRSPTGSHTLRQVPGITLAQTRCLAHAFITFVIALLAVALPSPMWAYP